MCGIAGFTASGYDADAARLTLQRMIAVLHHRGPDGRGYHLEEGVGLAHARLSIIDLAAGAQPMSNADGSLWTVFNGEIFNYVELRADLVARGHQFRTQSDTEVLLHLYERHGDDFVDHLNGQFAIALWDRRRRRLLLARDRAGIRPLFHCSMRGRTWFASEPRALLAALPECAALDPMGLAQAFTYWAPVDPDTVYRGIRSVPPGHVLAIEADGAQTSRRYWDWSFPARGAPPEFSSLDSAIEQLRELLVDAVRLQLRADVPVGAYLSGGLDSSGLVAIAQRLTTTPMRTFSLTFEDPEFDEGRQQAEMVEHLGTAHSTLRCTRRQIGEAFPRFVSHAQVPVLRTAGAPLMLLSGLVREQGYKVVLSGEGADEVFGGYDLFKEARIRRFWSRQPESKVRPLLLSRLYGYLHNSPVRAPAFAQAFFGQGMEHLHRPVFAHAPRWTTSHRALQFLSSDMQAEVAGFRPLDFYESRLPQGIGDWSPLGRDQYVEAKSMLSGYLLAAQGDRPAMANSVEGRVPYLDHRLIEFASRLPPRWKISGLTEKYILRRALQGLLPPSITMRTKQPYRAPDSQSFFSDGVPLDYVAEAFDATRVRSAGYFDPAATRALFEKCRAGRATGFADNQAFVGILSTMLLDRGLRDIAAPVAEH